MKKWLKKNEWFGWTLFAIVMFSLLVNCGLINLSQGAFKMVNISALIAIILGISISFILGDTEWQKRRSEK